MSRKIKDKQESSCASIDNARHALVTPDLSGLKRKADEDADDLNDIMSVLDQISIVFESPVRSGFFDIIHVNWTSNWLYKLKYLQTADRTS
jgi:hypothetical protein